jgi:regulator of protease activity HflC (stomatin/prohibitin superfamily)
VSTRARKQGNMGQVCCCTCVEQARVGIVERFGKYERIAGPGFQCVNWMCGRRLAGFISLRVQQLDVRCETKTKVSYNVHAVQHCVLVFAARI